jgi:inorganic pyrophosphatase
MVYGRVIGVMGMEDNGEFDDKIICVNNKDPRYNEIKSIDDLREFEKKDLQTFMETYKYAQTGPGSIKITGFPRKRRSV